MCSFGNNLQVEFFFIQQITRKDYSEIALFQFFPLLLNSIYRGLPLNLHIHKDGPSISDKIYPLVRRY